MIYIINSNIRMSHWKSPAILFVKEFNAVFMVAFSRFSSDLQRQISLRTVGCRALAQKRRCLCSRCGVSEDVRGTCFFPKAYRTMRYHIQCIDRNSSAYFQERTCWAIFRDKLKRPNLKVIKVVLFSIIFNPLRTIPNSK